MEKEFNRGDLEKSYAEMNRLRIEEKKNQMATEFTRYKQDCRKRAIDLGMELANPKSVENAIAHADSIYNWLITIPD